MGSSYSSENDVNLNLNKNANNFNNEDLINRIKNIVDKEENGSDTLGDITELNNKISGGGNNIDEISSIIKQNISKRNKHEKYDIKNIMGRVHNKLITMGNNLEFSEKNNNHNDSLTTLNLSILKGGGDDNKENEEDEKKDDDKDEKKDDDKDEKKDNDKDDDLSLDLDPSDSNLGTSESGNRVENLLIKNIMESEQKGGKKRSDSSSSSSDSIEDEMKKGKSHYKVYEKQLKNNNGHKKIVERDSIVSLGDKLEKMEKDIDEESSNQSENESSSEEDDEELVSVNNDSEMIGGGFTSNGSVSGGGLNIFPFNSESISYHNYKVIKRSI